MDAKCNNRFDILLFLISEVIDIVTATFVDIVFITFVGILFATFSDTLSVAFIISSHTITEVSAVLVNSLPFSKNTCARIPTINFFSYDIFYTCIGIYHYSVFNLKCKFCY